MITIAIPVYNREDKVKRTLDSIRTQTFRPFGVVLVDNNSTDNSLRALYSWKESNESSDLQVRVIKEAKPGASAARNAALEIIDTEWTMFFDSDDEMPPDHIEKVTRVIYERPEAELIGWDRKTFRKDGKIIYKPFRTRDFQFENLTHSNLATQSYIAKTDIFRKAGGWDIDLKVGLDIDLGSRILSLNPKIIRIPNHYVNVFESEESITYNVFNRAENIWRTLKKIKNQLPEENKHWADFHMINSAASWAKNDPESKKIIDEILNSTPFLRRTLWKLFYLYGRLGGRGAAYIYRIISMNTLLL